MAVTQHYHAYICMHACNLVIASHPMTNIIKSLVHELVTDENVYYSLYYSVYTTDYIEFQLVTGTRYNHISNTAGQAATTAANDYYRQGMSTECQSNIRFVQTPHCQSDFYFQLLVNGIYLTIWRSAGAEWAILCHVSHTVILSQHRVCA